MLKEILTALFKDQKTPIKNYFSKKEVKDLKPELVERLNKTRHRAGIPFIINSGFRSKAKNKRVGGVPNSAHLAGNAVDIRCKRSTDRFKIVNAALEEGFKRIGIGKTFVHLDIDITKPQEVIWLYGK